jgi:hypothetical protein
MIYEALAEHTSEDKLYDISYTCCSQRWYILHYMQYLLKTTTFEVIELFIVYIKVSLIFKVSVLRTNIGQCTAKTNNVNLKLISSNLENKFEVNSITKLR